MIISTCSEGFIGVAQYLKGLSQADNIHYVPRISDVTTEASHARFHGGCEAVILGGWSGEYPPIITFLSKELNIPVYLTWHSPLYQIELSKEIPQLKHIISLVANRFVKGLIVSDPRLVPVFSRQLSNRVFFLPHAIYLKELEPYRIGDYKKFVSALGPNHERKNRLVHLAALDILTESGIDTVTNFNLDTPQFKVKWRHSWLNRNDLLSIISKTRVGLCVTVSESFNYNLWEYLGLGSPVVTSLDQRRYLRNLCDDVGVQFQEAAIFAADMNDPQQIAELSLNLIKDLGDVTVNRFVNFVEDFNAKSVAFINSEATKLL